VISTLAALVVCFLVWWLTSSPLAAVPIIAIDSVVALSSTFVVRWQLDAHTARIFRCRCNAPDQEFLKIVRKEVILPFLRRNEQTAHSPNSAEAFTISRLKDLESRCDAVISRDELEMLDRLLKSRGVALWESLDAAKTVLTAFALEMDLALFKDRLSRAEAEGVTTLTAYASLKLCDTVFLPFFQQTLRDRKTYLEANTLRDKLSEVRSELRLHAFAADLGQRADESITVTMDSVDRMDPFNFEVLVGMVYEARGYTVVVTPKAGDQGADLIAERLGQRTAIQTKLYAEPVGNKAVQEVVAARLHFRCHSAIVVTNNCFTRSAEELACSTDVQLIDRNGLEKMLGEFNRAPKDYGRLTQLLQPLPSA